MNWILPIVVCLVVAAVSYSIGRSYRPSKDTPKKEEKLDVLKVIEDVKFSNTIHPLVKDIYLLFVDKPEGYKNFKLDSHDLVIRPFGVEIWASNEADNRYFRSVSIELLKKYNLTMRELNESLTKADQQILDTIVQRVKVNDKEFISRLFI
jgi:hypothetical protein